MPAAFPEPVMNRSRCQKDSPKDERIEKHIHAGNKRRMIDVVRVQDQEDKERQADARPISFPISVWCPSTAVAKITTPYKQPVLPH